MRFNTKHIIAILLLVSPLTFLGQNSKSYKAKTNSTPIARVKQNFNGKQISDNTYFYLIAGVGTNLLHGDNGRRYEPGFNGNISIGLQLHKYVGLEGKVGYSTLSGKYYGVESHFSNTFETNINLMINLTNIIFGNQSGRKYDIIPHIGWGQLQSRGRVVYENGKKTSYGYENYLEHNNNLIDGKIDGRFNPNGGGIGGRVVSRMHSAGILFNYIINDSFKVGLDIISTRADTDRLDAVPAGYHYDWFTTFDVRVQYRLRFREHKTSPCDNVFSDYKHKVRR